MWASIGLGIPLVALILGSSLVWAFFGFAAKQPSNAVLDPVGTREGPLTLRADQASFKGEGGFGADATVVRAAQHQQMLSWIEVLEALLVELPKQRRPGIGHNLQPITEGDVQETTQAISILKVQPVAPKAPDEAKAAASTLKKIGERLGTYLDTCLLEASKSGDVAPNFYPAAIGVWPSVVPGWAVMAAVRGAEPSVERSAADRRATA